MKKRPSKAKREKARRENLFVLDWAHRARAAELRACGFDDAAAAMIESSAIYLENAVAP